MNACHSWERTDPAGSTRRSHRLLHRAVPTRVGHDTPPTDELVTLVAESWRILPLPTSPVSCAGLPSVPDPEPTAPLARDLGTNRGLIISSE